VQGRSANFVAMRTMVVLIFGQPQDLGPAPCKIK
jgi:hypothetical protein